MSNFMLGLIAGVLITILFLQDQQSKSIRPRPSRPIATWNGLKDGESPVRVIVVVKKQAEGIHGEVAERAEAMLADHFKESHAPVRVVSERLQPAEYSKLKDVFEATGTR